MNFIERKITMSKEKDSCEDNKVLFKYDSLTTVEGEKVGKSGDYTVVQLEDGRYVLGEEKYE